MEYKLVHLVPNVTFIASIVQAIVSTMDPGLVFYRLGYTSFMISLLAVFYINRFRTSMKVVFVCENSAPRFGGEYMGEVLRCGKWNLGTAYSTLVSRNYLL